MNDEIGKFYFLYKENNPFPFQKTKGSDVLKHQILLLVLKKLIFR